MTLSKVLGVPAQLLLLSILAQAQTALTTSQNPSIFGASVTLTATVTPSNATGRVTFYDGVTILGTKPLSAGMASISTILLPSGTRKLTAYYSGDNTHVPSTANFTQTVKSVPAVGFRTGSSVKDGYSSFATMAGADFNDDGRADLATAGDSFSGVSLVTILLGNGDGTFQPPATYPVGGTPLYMVIADLNDDGNSDIAVNVPDNQGHMLVSLLMGNGDGTFRPAITIPAARGPMAVADFNGDGRPDLLLMADSVAAGALLLGNGDGTFRTPLAVQPASFFSVAAVAVGDFNGDGKPDIAIADIGLEIALGNGDGTFQPFSSSLNIGFFALSLTAGDFNGDGKLDLVLGNNSSQSVVLGNGDGTFLPPVIYPIQGYAMFNDFNGDGIGDLAIVNSHPGFASDAVSLLQGNGDGTFHLTLSYTTPTSIPHFGLVAADFNGDGRVDLIGRFISQAASSTVVLLGVGSGMSLTATSGTPQSTLAGTRFSIPLEVILVQNGTPVNSAVVNFSAPSNGASAVLTSTTSVTNTAGFAAINATANNIPGDYVVTASYQGLIASFALSNTTIASVVATAGTPQSILVGMPFLRRLQAIVRDSAGNLATGAPVTFTAPTSGASASVQSPQITDAGQANVTAYANGTAGSYTVIASAGGLSATFSLTNTSLKSVIASGGASQSATVGMPFARALDVTVRDSAGNPVSFLPVDFSAPVNGATAVLSFGRVFTNDAGVASVTATANNIPGAYSVTASAGTFSTSFSLTNLPMGNGGGNPPQGKIATQSSTLPGYPTAGAASAIDGSTDGTFFNGSVTHTNFDNNPWWQLDLGSSITVSSITIWNRTDCCGSRLNDYWVFVSDTPFSPTDTPATLQNRAGTFSSHQTIAPNPSASLQTGGVQGRYVRVQLTGANYLSLAEVLVAGLGAPAVTNLAVGKAAAQSSTIAGSAAAAVDGSTDGNFFNGSVTHTDLNANAWWQVDLGASAAVTSIAIWNRTDCCGSRLTDYWVFVSDAPFGLNDTPATLQNRAGTFSRHQLTPPDPSTSIPVGAQGRYVRVQLTGANYLSLAEVQVMGTGGPATSNLAQGKAAAQSSTVSGTASAAVDGNTDGNFFNNSVTHTNLDANAWWQVDLGASSAINSIVIWNRTDCCGTRMNDYWVFVSDTPFGPSDTPATLQIRAGTFTSHQTGAPNPSTTIPAVAQGRYVRVQLSGANYLSLAEVQVIGQ